MNNKGSCVNTSNCPAGAADGGGGGLKKENQHMNDERTLLQIKQLRLALANIVSLSE